MTTMMDYLKTQLVIEKLKKSRDLYIQFRNEGWKFSGLNSKKFSNIDCEIISGHNFPHMIKIGNYKTVLFILPNYTVIELTNNELGILTKLPTFYLKPIFNNKFPAIPPIWFNSSEIVYTVIIDSKNISEYALSPTPLNVNSVESIKELAIKMYNLHYFIQTDKFHKIRKDPDSKEITIDEITFCINKKLNVGFIDQILINDFSNVYIESEKISRIIRKNFKLLETSLDVKFQCCYDDYQNLIKCEFNRITGNCSADCNNKIFRIIEKKKEVEKNATANSHSPPSEGEHN